MRIERVATKNFLGLPTFSVDLPAGVTICAGANGAGKSSLLESVRFALAGETVRGVKLKADIKSLLSDGTKDGNVSVIVNGEVFKRSLKNGEYASNYPTFGEALTYVLDAHRFASVDQDTRRTFLFDLLNVDRSHATIAAMLEKAQVPKAIVDEVKPLLRAGFEGAERYAKEQAAQARGAWKAITGENYGDQKANDWSAPESVTGDVDETLLRDQAQALPELTERHADVLKTLGVAEAREAAAKDPDLATARELLPEWRKQVDNGNKRAGDLRAELQRLEARHVLTLECPCCQEALILVGNDLQPYQDGGPSGGDIDQRRSEARAQLDTVTSAVQKVERKISIGERLIADAEGADGDVAALKAELKQIDADIGRARLARETLQIRRNEAEQAGRKKVEADKHHAAVQNWKACADQLAPSGIQATLLAQALYPINMQLGAASDLIEFWRRVEIQPDMTITYGGRPYVKCSESERWRADAMLADAIAKLSKINVLLLDRFDVLDHDGRSEAINWLLNIAPNYDTVLVGATLKSPPVIDGINVVWLDDQATGRRAA